MCEREKLPKQENSNFIELQEEMNGEIEELLEDDKVNITDINILIYAAGAIMTQTLNKQSKRSKNRRGVKSWKIRMQKQISSWRKGFSIISVTGTGSDNGKLNTKKRKNFKKYRVTYRYGNAQMTETLKQKLQAKAQKFRRYGKMETQYKQNKVFKENPKKFYTKMTMKNIEAREPSSMAESKTNWKSLWGEEHSIVN